MLTAEVLVCQCPLCYIIMTYFESNISLMTICLQYINVCMIYAVSSLVLVSQCVFMCIYIYIYIYIYLVVIESLYDRSA